MRVLEDKLGIDGRDDVRLRLLGEFSLAAWRCGAKNWIAGRDPGGTDAGRCDAADVGALAARVHDAFDAVPASHQLRAR